MTRPNQEAIAEENLQRQGFTPYCPRYQQKRPGKTSVIRPLFPRYIFILIDKLWYAVKGTRGISRVLLNDLGPQILPTPVITELKRHELGGLIQLQAPPRYKKGEKVKCETGPLAGLPLLYEGQSNHDRVWVLTQLMGQMVPCEVEERLLVAA